MYTYILLCCVLFIACHTCDDIFCIVKNQHFYEELVNYNKNIYNHTHNSNNCWFNKIFGHILFFYLTLKYIMYITFKNR